MRFPDLHLASTLLVALCLIGCTRGQVQHAKEAASPTPAAQPDPTAQLSSSSPAWIAALGRAAQQPVANSNGNENELSTPMNFDRRKVNLYVTDSSGHISILNFFTERIPAYHHHLWPQHQTIELFTGSGAEPGYPESDGEIYVDTYPGLSIRYFRMSGDVAGVTIDGSEYYVENGIRVGSTKRQVLGAFPNGFSTWHYGSVVNATPSIYYFLEMAGTDSGDVLGKGFLGKAPGMGKGDHGVLPF